MAENIRVAVRCRPMSSREVSLGSKGIIMVNNKRTIVVANPKDAEDTKSFTFDFAYDSESLQTKVYEELGLPIINRAMEGYNGTIFAYGQTGSGKTHTMMGTGEDIGIVPKLLATLFANVQAKTSMEAKFMITVSYLEIYNEVVHDLLNPTERELRIREHADLGIYVDGLCEIVVHNEADVFKLLDQGNAIRHVAATQMNGRSSRSHSCFTTKIELKTTTTDGMVARETSLTSKLNLVDLAGSERASKTGATGSTLKEGASINASLMTLGKVINALAEGAQARGQHIPYRESKLTRLLQESLGGNSATTMVAAISPADYNFEETISTLKYASRAKSIKNEVTRNEDVNEKMIRELKTEIESLRQQLASSNPVPSSPTSQYVDPALQERLLQLEALQQQSWEDRERLSRQLEHERASNTSTVITSALDLVKQQKLEMMKMIKRLQNTKTQLTQTQQAKREAYQATKNKYEKDMQRYHLLQNQFDSNLDEGRRQKIEEAMVLLLDNVGENRDELELLANELNQIRADLKRNENELTERKAELVAHVGILDANVRLREQVAAEERAKWDADKATFLSRELEAERLRLDKAKDEALREAGRFKNEFDRALASEVLLQQRTLELETERGQLAEKNQQLENQLLVLEGRMAESEVDWEIAEQEINQLKRDMQIVKNEKQENEERQAKLIAKNEKMLMQYQGELQELKGLLNVDSSRVEGVQAQPVKVGRKAKTGKRSGQDYGVFRDLLDMVHEERAKMEAKFKETQSLLRKAIEDVLFLSAQNEDLQQELKRARTWEMPIT